MGRNLGAERVAEDLRGLLLQVDASRKDVSGERRPVVAVVGAGFSGALLALHLLKAGPKDPRVLLIERGGVFGRGLAYGTRNPRHLLNVCAGDMSAWPEDPDHLQRWLSERGEPEGGQSTAFISRGLYGDYLSSLVRDAGRDPENGDRLRLETDQVVGLTREGGRTRLTLATGRAIEADAVALAVGNLPPAPPRGTGLDKLPPHLYAADPWAESAFEDLADDAPVLLLGSGLTMVDVTIDLATRGHVGPVLALSRRGLAPRGHGASPPALAATALAAPMPLSRRLALVRRRTREAGWRTAMDEQRAATQGIWRDASEVERRRFLRHLRPWWDVHRHRMAPAVADWIDGERASGRLTIRAGRLAGAVRDGNRARVNWRPRGSTVDESARVARIVNCSGAGADLARTGDPLLRGLIGDGLARPDPLGLGLEVDVGGRVIDAGGQADPALYAVGPISRGALWEIVAVPEIRRQLTHVAQALVERARSR